MNAKFNLYFHSSQKSPLPPILGSPMPMTSERVAYRTGCNFGVVNVQDVFAAKLSPGWHLYVADELISLFILGVMKCKMKYVKNFSVCILLVISERNFAQLKQAKFKICKTATIFFTNTQILHSRQVFHYLHKHFASLTGNTPSHTKTLLFGSVPPWLMSWVSRSVTIPKITPLTVTFVGNHHRTRCVFALGGKRVKSPSFSCQNLQSFFLLAWCQIWTVSKSAATLCLF